MYAATERITRKFIGAVEDEWQLFSCQSSDYAIGPPIGFGASSTVYIAQFQPPNASRPVPCALKVLDLDRLPPSTLRLLQRETQLMSLSKHPNILRVRGTWMDGHKLYIAMRLMNAGSAVDVMRYAWPGGFEEEVVKCILRQALEGLNYLHTNGLIHRDVKPANLLIDDDGTVLLGDLGVAAFLWDADDPPPSPHLPAARVHKRTSAPHRHHTPHTYTHTQPHAHTPHTPHHRVHPHKHTPLHPPPSKRKSFVGTPCYMAPEVISGHTYDASADIWSFGITALELTQGRAPRSLVPPQTALLQTVRDAPPTLDRSAGVHAYSRALQEAIAACLEKDPARRPSAQALLASPLFRGAKKKGYLMYAILQGLPPLPQRMERRRQPSLMTHATVESWDFGSAAASPTASVYSRRVLAPEGAPEFGDSEGGAVAGAGEGAAEGRRSSAEAYAMRVRGRSRPLSRNVSWGEEDLHGSGLGPILAEHVHPAPIAEVDLSAAPESSSDSEMDASPTLEKAALPLADPSPSISSSPSSSSESYVPDCSADLPQATPISTPTRSAFPSSSPGLWRRITAKFDSDKEKRAERMDQRQRGSFDESEKSTPSGTGIVRVKSRTLGVLSLSVSGGGGGGGDTGAK